MAGWEEGEEGYEFNDFTKKHYQPQQKLRRDSIWHDRLVCTSRAEI